MKTPANVSLLTLLHMLFLSYTPTPELGDLRYIEAQRACLAINLNEVNEDFLEGPPPTETQLQDVRRKCKDIGYEWTYTSETVQS